MRNPSRRLLAAVALCAAAAGCREGPPRDAVRMVVTNATGGRMHGFSLTVGSERVMAYDVVEADSTFAEWAPAAGTQMAMVRYVDGTGSVREIALERPVTVDMAGGDYRITFGAEGRIALRMDWP